MLLYLLAFAIGERTKFNPLLVVQVNEQVAAMPEVLGGFCGNRKTPFNNWLKSMPSKVAFSLSVVDPTGSRRWKRR